MSESARARGSSRVDRRRAERIMRALAAADPILTETDASILFHVLAHLQLALSHPGTRGSATSVYVRRWADVVAAELIERVPELAWLIEQGWRDVDVP